MEFPKRLEIRCNLSVQIIAVTSKAILKKVQFLFHFRTKISQIIQTHCPAPRKSSFTECCLGENNSFTFALTPGIGGTAFAQLNGQSRRDSPMIHPRWRVPSKDRAFAPNQNHTSTGKPCTLHNSALVKCLHRLPENCTSVYVNKSLIKLWVEVKSTGIVIKTI